MKFGINLKIGSMVVEVTLRGLSLRQVLGIGEHLISPKIGLVVEKLLKLTKILILGPGVPLMDPPEGKVLAIDKVPHQNRLNVIEKL